MLANYLKIALRSIFRNRTFSFINLLGLSFGMTAFIMIFQYVSFEKSVNGFHRNLPNLYRVLFEVSFQGQTNTWESVPPALGTLAKDQFPEVDKYCRVMAGSSNGVVSYLGDANADIKSFKEEKIVHADGNFFEVFTFTTLAGNPNGIARPNTVAISQSMAAKYFNTQRALGKVLTLDNQFGKALYTVTSIYKDFPANSDLQYDMVFSLQTLANAANLNGNSWADLESLDTQFIETYLVTKEGSNYLALEDKLNQAKKKLRPEAVELVRLQPAAHMHLPQSLSDYYTTFGSLKFVYILQGIAVLILVIAWFNFINLSTAAALKRAKEVGIRKVIGASRLQLIRQFLGESLLLNVAAFLLALAFVNLVQGAYNQLIQKELSLTLLTQNGFWIIGLTLIFLGSLSSGAYTSFALSSFKPSETLKGVFGHSIRGQWLRKSLVVFQFSISVVLIASTFILYRQLEYMKNKDLGMKLDQLIVLPEPEIQTDTTFRGRTLAFRNELAQQNFVRDYSMSGSIPGSWYNYTTTGYTRTNPQPGDEKINYAITFMDERYLPVYDISLLAGKNFNPEDCNKRWKERNKIIINERAADLLGFESGDQAIGQKITDGERELEVTGVIVNYHHLSLQKAIEPVIIFPSYNPHYFTLKITTDNVQANVDQLEILYKKYFPGNPFAFFFADQRYNQQYQSEQQYGTVFSIASALAIFIACLGLFGLATFTVEQRVKEIGVRKVLGAGVIQITVLLSKDFLLLVIVAIGFASPLTWWIMSQWLEGFAYRTEITWWIFGSAGAAAVMIALATVGSQSIKAALSNPVDSLKNE